jgi:hypothetical protein
MFIYKKLLLIFVVCAVAAITVPAQLPGYTEVTPVLARPDQFGFTHSVEGCDLRENGIYDEAKLKPLLRRKECAEWVKTLNVDFVRHTLVAYSAAGDCHMQVVTKVFRSEREKKYLVIINHIYGGCRAAGWRQGWIVLEKIPADYTLEIKEVRIDRNYGPDVKGFQFPVEKKPSGIKPEILESREIDVKECLPLERQSQWILIKNEFLQTAIEGKGTKCAEYFNSLAIDFNNYTLAGYNVNTGHCQRPESLEQKLVKDFDEKSYTLMITYAPPRGSCDVATYHPVWVLVPKLPEGYSFNFEVNGHRE